MSERTPLLSGSVNGQSLPSRREVQNTVQNNMPSKAQRIQVAQAKGALAAGKLPSQDQLSKLLQLVIDSDTLKASGGPNTRTARLGAEGSRVLENVKNVLSASKAWGDEKNGDDLIQNFFYNASHADIDVDINAASAPVSKKELSKDSQRAIESFRTIASLIVTSPEFRKIGSDVILLTRDIFADAAVAVADGAKDAAEKSRPSESEKKKGVDFDKLQQKGKSTARHLATGKIQADARESIWDEVEQLQEYVDEKLPAADEAKERFIERLQAVVKGAQEKPEYKRSITAIVGLFKKYAHKAEDALKETAEKSKVSDEDEKVQQAGRDLKQFIEKVSNKSIDGVIKASQKAADDVKNNEKLSLYFNDLESYVHRLLYQPGYVASRSAARKASSLFDDAQALLKENADWKRDAQELQNQLQGLIDGVKNDETTNQLVDSIQELGDSLATAGQIGFGALRADGQGLYRDFMDVIVPRVIGLIKEIPVPRIEFKSEDVDLVIDDFNFESASFIPDSVRFVAHNDLRFTQGYATYASEYDSSVRFRIQGLHFEASNIAFWVNKKTGFWPFEDYGLLDFKFGPDGIDFDVTLENADDSDSETFFTVKDVDVKIRDFDFNISKNYRWFATWFAGPFLKAFIKKNMSDAIEAQVRDYLHSADGRLFALQQRAIAATNARPSPANFVNAIVSDTIFPKKSTMGPVKLGQKGVVKYGRHGEYLLHIGVDEDLFPSQPPKHLRNPQREKLKAQAKSAAGQAKSATGISDPKRAAQDAKIKLQKEGNELDARAREQQRREQRQEGWRSEAFDV